MKQLKPLFITIGAVIAFTIMIGCQSAPSVEGVPADSTVVVDSVAVDSVVVDRPVP